MYYVFYYTQHVYTCIIKWSFLNKLLSSYQEHCTISQEVWQKSSHRRGMWCEICSVVNKHITSYRIKEMIWVLNKVSKVLFW